MILEPVAKDIVERLRMYFVNICGNHDDVPMRIKDVLVSFIRQSTDHLKNEGNTFMYPATKPFTRETIEEYKRDICFLLDKLWEVQEEINRQNTLNR